MNRHTRRAEGKDTRGTRKRPVGYRGQKFEVQAGKYGEHRNFTVGWANDAGGVANLISMVNKHPLMSDPKVKELSEAEREALSKG